MPLLTLPEWLEVDALHPQLNFLLLESSDLDDFTLQKLKASTGLVLVFQTSNAHALAELRQMFFELLNHKITHPVVIKRAYDTPHVDAFQLYAATDCGGLLVDGFGDGLWLSAQSHALSTATTLTNNLAFGILQAARTRMSKTEYISCPSCGRTLFDLQETTAMIRKRTDHLKGVKIGIMGCIVNGPGEMADADYGYVGIGKDKIALYRGQNVVKRSVPAEKALDELIDLMREDGIWFEPDTVEVLA